MELDNNFKQLVQQLGEAIDESLKDSERISDVLARMRKAGYELLLVLEVTVGFNKPGTKQNDDRGGSAAKPPQSQSFELTSKDAQFLRALKITIEDKKS